MEEKKAVLTDEIFGLADDLRAKKELKKDLESQVKALNAEIERLDRDLSDAMAEAECPSFTRGGSTFSLRNKLYASPRAGMSDVLMRELKQRGYGDIVKETVNANTLSSFCREQMELSGDGERLPGWLSEAVSTFEKVSVSIRKSKR